jgi:ATP-dependent protease ClpP protease subunit
MRTLLYFVLAIVLITVFMKECQASVYDTDNSIKPFTKQATLGYSLAKIGGDYHVYLGTAIGSAYYYQDLIRGLGLLDTDDTVIIHMANYGGQVHSGVRIINAMKSSPAVVKVVVEGPSYSMGALITCAADEVIMHPYTYLMFHHYSGTFSGKGSDSRALIKALDRLSYDLMMNECVPKGILTPQQVTDILNGKDVYAHP